MNKYNIKIGVAIKPHTWFEMSYVDVYAETIEEAIKQCCQLAKTSLGDVYEASWNIRSERILV